MVFVSPIAAGHYERWGAWQLLSEKELASAGYPGLLRVD